MPQESILQAATNQIAGLNNSVGFILTDPDLKIIQINQKAKHQLSITDEVNCGKIIDIFSSSNSYYAKNRSSDNSLNKFHRSSDIEKIVNIIYQIVINEKTPVQYIAFWPYQGEYKSLLIHAIPAFDEKANVVAVEHIISGYSMWGIQEYFSLTESLQANFLIPMPDDFKFKVQLTNRQHEVLFLMVSGISQRMASQILEISYGTLSRIVRESICPRFGIEDNDIVKLVARARKMGYDKYIPQSLCRPCIIVQDHNLVVKYFNF